MNLCNHKEADTQILVHINHALEEGRKVFRDTDILVKTVSVLPTQQETRLQHLWISLAKDRTQGGFQYMTLCLSLAVEKMRGILFMPSMATMLSQYSMGKGKQSVNLANLGCV